MSVFKQKSFVVRENAFVSVMLLLQMLHQISASALMSSCAHVMFSVTLHLNVDILKDLFFGWTNVRGRGNLSSLFGLMSDLEREICTLLFVCDNALRAFGFWSGGWIEVEYITWGEGNLFMDLLSRQLVQMSINGSAIRNPITVKLQLI